MMNHFLGHRNLNTFQMTFVIIFVVLIFFEIRPAAAQQEELILMSRDEFVDMAGYGEEKLSTVAITGKLLCHGGEKHKSPRGSSHPHPVSGASLAVFCSGTNKKITKKSWARGSTNSYGEFIIDLPSHLHAVQNLEKICLVKVLHLPKSSPCRHAFTGKRKGIELASVGEGVRVYTTHNIHLMTKPSRVQNVKRGAKKIQIM